MSLTHTVALCTVPELCAIKPEVISHILSSSLAYPCNSAIAIKSDTTLKKLDEEFKYLGLIYDDNISINMHTVQKFPTTYKLVAGICIVTLAMVTLLSTGAVSAWEIGEDYINVDDVYVSQYVDDIGVHTRLYDDYYSRYALFTYVFCDNGYNQDEVYAAHLILTSMTRTAFRDEDSVKKMDVYTYSKSDNGVEGFVWAYDKNTGEANEYRIDTQT